MLHQAAENFHVAVLILPGDGFEIHKAHRAALCLHLDFPEKTLPIRGDHQGVEAPSSFLPQAIQVFIAYHRKESVIGVEQLVLLACSINKDAAGHVVQYAV